MPQAAKRGLMPETDAGDVMITIRIHHADRLFAGDTDGDGEPDFGIALDGARLTAADIIL